MTQHAHKSPEPFALVACGRCGCAVAAHWFDRHETHRARRWQLRQEDTGRRVRRVHPRRADVVADCPHGGGGDA